MPEFFFLPHRSKMVTIYFSVLILIFKGKNRNKIIHIDDLKIFKALQKYMK